MNQSQITISGWVKMGKKYRYTSLSKSGFFSDNFSVFNTEFSIQFIHTSKSLFYERYYSLNNNINSAKENNSTNSIIVK